ncbi:MAG: hypothetical protein ABII89_04310 [Candidatus Omnitrophota bacterium]
MDTNELEREIIRLAGEIREEKLPESLVPATLNILHSHCNRHTSPLAGEAKWGGARQSRLSLLATLFLFFLFIPFFSFSLEPTLNVIRLILLLLSIATGTALFFKPEMIAGIDRKILGSRLSRLGPAATRSQEILLFRFQAVYFILIALFICRL